MSIYSLGHHTVVIALAWLASAPLIFCAPSETTEWQDGFSTYPGQTAGKGYLVPRNALGSLDVFPSELVKVSERVPQAVLRAWAQGSKSRIEQDEHLLLRYPNQGRNIVQWEGASQGHQIIISNWNGQYWQPSSAPSQSSNTVELVFELPASQSHCYVLIRRQGTSTPDVMTTDRVSFGAFPGTVELLGKELSQSDLVIYRPPTARKEPHLPLDPAAYDCLVGKVHAGEVSRLADLVRGNGDEVWYFDRVDGQLRVRFRYSCSGCMFVNPNTGVRLYVPLRPRDTRQIRWQLSKYKEKPTPPALELTTRLVDQRADGFRVHSVEVSVGRDEPVDVFRRPRKAHQRDGGESLVRFEVRVGDATVLVEPQGRFGADSFTADWQQLLDGLDYRFVRSGPGVLKLLLRAAAGLRVGVTAHYTKLDHPLGPAGDVVSSPTVPLLGS